MDLQRAEEVGFTEAVAGGRVERHERVDSQRECAWSICVDMTVAIQISFLKIKFFIQAWLRSISSYQQIGRFQDLDGNK